MRCHCKMTATEWVNLKTMNEVIGRLFLINYSLGTNSTVKPFKQLGVAKSTIYKVLQSLENWWDTEKQLASERPAVNLTKGKRKQPVNAAMDNDRISLTKMPKNWEFTRFMFRECLRGAWRDRDTNGIFAHCSLIFYFLDFKFSTLSFCTSSPDLVLFKKFLQKKEKYLKNHPKRLSS